MSKKIRYKGIEVQKPENISMNLVKRLVDEIVTFSKGATVQNVVDLISGILEQQKK